MTDQATHTPCNRERENGRSRFHQRYAERPTTTDSVNARQLRNGRSIIAVFLLARQRGAWLAPVDGGVRSHRGRPHVTRSPDRPPERRGNPLPGRQGRAGRPGSEDDGLALPVLTRGQGFRVPEGAA